MNFFKSFVFLQCPKCRQGKMFSNPPYSFKSISSLHQNCPNCRVSFQLEPSFFYGSMYVSYAIGVAIGVAVFVILFLLGYGKKPLTIFGAICLAIVTLSPYVYQLSKVIWASFFISFDPKRGAKNHP